MESLLGLFEHSKIFQDLENMVFCAVISYRIVEVFGNLYTKNIYFEL